MSKRGRKPIDSEDRKSVMLRLLVTESVDHLVQLASISLGLSKSDVLRLALLGLLFPTFSGIIGDPTFENVADIYCKRSTANGKLPPMQDNT